jgi:hypothetical protein
MGLSAVQKIGVLARESEAGVPVPLNRTHAQSKAKKLLLPTDAPSIVIRSPIMILFS